MQNRSFASARVRWDASTPSKWLTTHNKVPANHGTLDYGCGRGFDADFFNWDKYDPHFFPQEPHKEYNFIVCTYVLNILTPKEEKEVIKKIKNLLTPTGVAYITVRRDRGNYQPQDRTYTQRRVVLDLPVVRKNQTYEIYEMRKNNGK